MRPLIGQAEIYRSLGTASVRHAADSAQTLRIALQRLFEELKGMSGEEVNENVQAALRAVIESRKRRARDMEAREELEQRISQMKSDQFRTEAEHRRVLEVAQAAHARAVVQAIASATVSAESKQREQPRVMLSAAIEEFARFKLAKKEWRGKTEEKMRAALELFLRAVGDQPLSHIGQPKVVEFLELLRRLPPNLQKLRALEGKTLHEIAALSLPPISEKTVADRLDAVIAFFRWCVQRGDCRLERSPADGLALGSPKSTERLPFSDQQLLRLLSSEEFQQRRFPNWYSFWLIPMALFTGARLGELCQLELANFVYVDDVCCIEIMDAGEEQTLKNRNSKRLVPLHDKLIEMGLMRHVEAAKREGKVRLFPELDLNVSASHVASKLFGRYRARCGVTGVEAPFHSFRHTFITRIMDAGGNLSQLAPIVGHGEKLITGNTYWNKRDARARREVVRLLAVPEEIATLLPAVEQVTVAKSSN